MGGGRARRLGTVDEAERTSHYARLPHTLAARLPHTLAARLPHTLAARLPLPVPLALFPGCLLLRFLDQIRDP